MDLKDAYFHIPLNQNIRPYLRMLVGDQTWECQAGCFGLNIMPKVFMDVMKTFQTKWRAKGIFCFMYLDDILVLGSSKSQVDRQLRIMVQDLVEAGFKINLKKSVLEAVQEVLPLGFVLNLKEGTLQLHPQRLKTVRKELGKLVVAKTMSTQKWSQFWDSSEASW